MSIRLRRREFVAGLGGAAIWPGAARAQRRSKLYRIGFLANDPTIPTTAAGRAFVEGLRENGFVEDQNIAIERRFLEGRVEGALDAVKELIRLNVDLIVTSGRSGSCGGETGDHNDSYRHGQRRRPGGRNASECPSQMARSAPRTPSELLNMLVTVGTARRSCRKFGKAQIFMPDRDSSGNPG